MSGLFSQLQPVCAERRGTYLGHGRENSSRRLRELWPEGFARARARDLAPSAVPPEYQRHRGFKQNSRTFDGSPRPQRYGTFAASWDEQRAYVRNAVKALAGTPLAAEARRELRRLRPARPSIKGFKPLSAKEPIFAGKFRVKFDRVTGALIHLRAEGAKQSLCAPKNPLDCSLPDLSQKDFDRFVKEYIVHLERNADWIIPDVTKPGMDKARPRPRHAFFRPAGARLYLRRGDKADVVLAALKMPAAVCRDVGAPRTVFLRYAFSHTEPVFRFGIALVRQGRHAFAGSGMAFVPAEVEPTQSVANREDGRVVFRRWRFAPGATAICTPSPRDSSRRTGGRIVDRERRCATGRARRAATVGV